MKVIAAVLGTAVGLCVLAVLVWLAVRAILAHAPRKGISESVYAPINGSRQWMSVYGKDRNNPVLLYLHGGPGVSTSEFDYVFTRKWADVYTVVTWDQRGCGKSRDALEPGTVITRELLLADGIAAAEYVCKWLGKEKIVLLGHSFGSCLGANLVLERPDLFERFIGTGQFVDLHKNELAFREAARGWAEGDPEGQALVDKLTPETLTGAHFVPRGALMQRYGLDMFANPRDYNLKAAMLFNPNYTLADWRRRKTAPVRPAEYGVLLVTDEIRRFSLLGRTRYEVPYCNINGSRDYQTSHLVAAEYFREVEAPRKEMYMMEGVTHGLLETRTEEFSRILHTVARSDP